MVIIQYHWLTSDFDKIRLIRRVLVQDTLYITLNLQKNSEKT